MTLSKRHHYLPQFYLRGFTNIDGEYYIYDKQTEEIRKTNPLNSFFENNRNSSFIKDEKSVLLEEMYTHFDTITAPEFEKIRSATVEDFVLEPEILHRVKMFITQMYWRIPENDQEFEKLVDQLTFAEAGFDFKDTKTGKSLATKELQDEFKSIDIFRKMYRLFLPLISTRNEYKEGDHDNWRVYFRANKMQLTSDNPLIIIEFVDFGSLNGELFFPLTCNKIMVHTKQPKPKELSSMFLLDLDMMIIQQATRFVCCSDKEYLKYLVDNLYSYSKNYDFDLQMKERLYSHFK